MIGSFEWGRVHGIPIKVHITLIILLPVIAVQFGPVLGTASMFWGLLAAAGLFASVALHELGHAYAAMAKGIRVREILLLPIGGIAQIEDMPNRARDEFHIAAAGPLASFALAAFLWAGGGLTAMLGLIQAGHLLRVLGFINLVLAIFNLLPSFPMDGGRIFRAWMTPRMGRINATRIAVRTGRIMAVFFGIIAILPPVNWFLLAIAIFIYFAAGAEYRMVLMQEAYRRRNSAPWPFPGHARPQRGEDGLEVTVGPPPYSRTRRSTASTMFSDIIRKQHKMFDDLFKNFSDR